MHIAKQFFAELEGIGAHNLRAYECRAEASCFWEGLRFLGLHCSFLSGAKMADDGGGTAQQTTAVGRPFSWFYAIDRSLKNNDQKDIPLDDRDWAEARDVYIVKRHGRAGICRLSRICERLDLAWHRCYFQIASAAVPRTMKARPMALRRESLSLNARRANSTDTTIDSLSICTTTLTWPVAMA